MVLYLPPREAHWPNAFSQPPQHFDNSLRRHRLWVVLLVLFVVGIVVIDVTEVA
jgi:hypothetical protein